MIGSVVDSGIGCRIGNQMINILAYADDIVLITPSWRAMQYLINTLNSSAIDINMTCNISKTVGMVFAPKERRWSLGTTFPNFCLGNDVINFVSQFKYLGHMLTNCASDDVDINREIRNIFVRTNILIRRFSNCSLDVKGILFKTYCLCFYDIALWTYFKVCSLKKFRSCYNRCAKLFFGFKRQDSLTEMLLLCRIPSFDTILHNSKFVFQKCLDNCANVLVKCF